MKIYSDIIYLKVREISAILSVIQRGIYSTLLYLFRD